MQVTLLATDTVRRNRFHSATAETSVKEWKRDFSIVVPLLAYAETDSVNRPLDKPNKGSYGCIFNDLHISLYIFHLLLDKILGPMIKKQNTRLREAISPGARLVLQY